MPSFLVLITYKLNLSNVPLFFAFAGVIACKLYFSCCLYDSNNGWRKLQPRRKNYIACGHYRFLIVVGETPLWRKLNLSKKHYFFLIITTPHPILLRGTLFAEPYY